MFDFFNNFYTESQANKNHSSLTFKLFCEDESSYESNSDEFFGSGDIIDLKKCKKIVLSYVDFPLDRHVDLTLNNGDTYGYSDFTIRGNDRDWVNGNFTKLDELLNSFEKQESIFTKHKTIFLHFVALSIGIIFYGFIDLIIGNPDPDPNPSEKQQAIRDFFAKFPYVRFLIIGVLIWIMGLIQAFPFRSWFYKKFFPLIEFNFGPEYTKIEKIRRKQLYAIISLIFIPFILAIFYDFIKELLR